MSQQINLFNPIFLKQKKYFSAVTMMQALGMILFGAIVLSIYAAYQLVVLKRENSATIARLSQAQAQLAQVSAIAQPRQKSKAIEESVKKTEGEVRELQQAYDTLEKGELGNRKGYSEYFKALSRQITPGLWLTGFTIYGAGNEIGVQGRALQPNLVPEFLARLKREPSMQGKSFATLEMQRPMVERQASVVQAGAKAESKLPVPAGYVEFKLASSGMSQEEKTAMPGANTK